MYAVSQLLLPSWSFLISCLRALPLSLSRSYHAVLPPVLDIGFQDLLAISPSASSKFEGPFLRFLSSWLDRSLEHISEVSRGALPLIVPCSSPPQPDTPFRSDTMSTTSRSGPLVASHDHEEGVAHHNFKPMAFESSDSSTAPVSIADIIEGLPTAVKSSLGPLRTIRRTVSIRGWASYFYEISANQMGTTASHEADAQHHTTVVSGTSTTAVEMQQSGHGDEKRLAAQESHSAAVGTAQGRNTTRQQPVTGLNSEEPGQNAGINRFCGLQGKNPHPGHRDIHCTITMSCLDAPVMHLSLSSAKCPDLQDNCL